jgi:hypothetical protein
LIDLNKKKNVMLKYQKQNSQSEICTRFVIFLILIPVLMEILLLEIFFTTMPRSPEYAPSQNEQIGKKMCRVSARRLST